MILSPGLGKAKVGQLTPTADTLSKKKATMEAAGYDSGDQQVDDEEGYGLR